jgi:phosphoribosylanthranilate isomerase
MSGLRVKICGLSRPGSVAAALEGGASHLGFIFFERSPRNVTPARARELVAGVEGRAATVAVTVDAGDPALDAIVAEMEPDMLQLHGGESPERVSELRQRYGRPVMKAIAVSGPEDIAAVAHYRHAADLILLDSRAPAGAGIPGGNGIAFDWALLDDIEGNQAYMLSGGLNIENVAEALQMARPWGIDVSSGVESSPGIKDDDRIVAFLSRVRQIEEEKRE